MGMAISVFIRTPKKIRELEICNYQKKIKGVKQKSQQYQKYRNCCMPQCRGLRFDMTHRFPRKSERLHEWLSALNQTSLARLPAEQLHRSIFVCSRHFRLSDYVHAESRSLNMTAVPNVNLRDLSELSLCRQTDSVTGRGSRLLSELNMTKATALEASALADADDTAHITLDERDDDAHDNTTIASPTTPEHELRAPGTARLSAAVHDEEDELLDNFAEAEAETKVEVEVLALALQPRKKSKLTASHMALKYRDIAELKSKLWNDETPTTMTPMPSLPQSQAAVDVLVVEDVQPATSSTANASGFKIALSGRWLEVRPQLDAASRGAYGGQPLKLDVLWLRYQCRCAVCYDATAQMSRFSMLQLSPHVRPDCATVLMKASSLAADAIDDEDDDGMTGMDDVDSGGAASTQLEILWSDGHKSTYGMVQLYALGAPPTAVEELQPANTLRLLWSAQHIKYRDDFKAMPAAQLLTHTSSVHTALDRLQRAGVLIIEAIEASTAAEQSVMAELLLRRLLPHLPATLEQEQRRVAPSADRVPCTNCTYASCDAALQVLSLSDADAATLTLVDGYQAAAQLKRNHTPAYDTLCQTSQTLLYRNEADLCHKRRTPAITLSPNGVDGAVERIHFSPSQLHVLTQRQFQQLLPPMRKYAAVLADVQLHWRCTLRRGMLIVLDNWRICWQTTNVSTLNCIYVSHKNYTAHLARLQLDR